MLALLGCQKHEGQAEKTGNEIIREAKKTGDEIQDAESDDKK